MTDENTNIESVASEKEIEALFVQTTHSMTYLIAGKLKYNLST